MKITLILVLVFLVISILPLAYSSILSMGPYIPSHEKSPYASSPHYDTENGIFQNRLPNLYAEIFKRFTLKDTWSTIKGAPGRSPERELTQVKPDLSAFSSEDRRTKVVWLGHSSVLLSIEGKNILLDPVFSKSSSPFSFLIPRFQEAPVTLEELPPIDYIVISHDHFDHLDMKVAQFYKDKKTRFLVPLGVGAHLRYWGVPDESIKEFQWWESYRDGELEFVSTPAQHSSGRGLWNINQTFWCSWVLQSPATKIYFSGDSGYDGHFKAIGDKYGPFDLAFIENGQYNEKWREVHLLPDESVQAFKDLKAKAFFPIHWGLFNLAWHRWDDPIKTLHRASGEQNIPLVTPVIGQIVILGEDVGYKTWWVQE